MGAANGAGGSIEPPDSACLGDFAFRAAGASFVSPTPKDLALTFSKLAYDPTLEHPITVVLLATNPSKATVAASPSLLMDTKEEFIAGLEPVFTKATIQAGRFFSAMPQSKGFVRIRGSAGGLDLQLGNMTLDATTSNDCGQAFVSIVTTVAASERSKTLVVDGESTTVGALAGGDAGSDFDLGMLFLAETVSFNFGSL